MTANFSYFVVLFGGGCSGGAGDGSTCVFLFFDFSGEELFIFCVFLGVVTSMVLSFLSSIFCRARFVYRYCLYMTVPWTILFYLSLVIEHFAAYSSLVWHLWSVRVWKISVQAFWHLELASHV